MTRGAGGGSLVSVRVRRVDDGRWAWAVLVDGQRVKVGFCQTRAAALDRADRKSAVIAAQFRREWYKLAG